jgi:hypothetical protein
MTNVSPSNFVVKFDDSPSHIVAAYSLAEVTNKIRGQAAGRIRVWAPSGVQLIDTKFGDEYRLIVKPATEPEPDRPEIQVDVRVVFIGPEYRYDVAPGLKIGEEGIIIRREGFHSQAVGGPRLEIVTVRFDAHEKAVNLDINRLTVKKAHD